MLPRKKKVLTVLCIGSVILVWRGYALITSYAPSAAQADSDTKTVALVPAVINSAQEDKKMEQTWEEQRRIADLPWGRNPCGDQSRSAMIATGPLQAIQPLDPTLPPAPAVKLGGVSRSDDQWLAAVDGNIVRVGDVVGEDYRVIKITQHTITLESAGWTFTYTMGAEAAVVRPPSEVK